MNVSTEIRQRVNQKIEQCIEVAKNAYRLSEVRFPKVGYRLTGTSAGRAHYITWEVEFNAALLTENVDEFIETTVPHEIAHLITDLVYPEAHSRAYGKKRSPHGAEWRSVMRTLGVANPQRCHTFDVASVSNRKPRTEYLCVACGKQYMLSAKMIGMIMGGSVRRCKCGQVVSVRSVQQAVEKCSIQHAALPKQGVIARPGSKIAQCMVIFQRMATAQRKDVIKAFISEVGMSEAAASTYYQTCKSKVAR